MNEPHWATVLRTAYESKAGTIQWVEAVGEEHDQRQRDWDFDLRKATDLSGKELEGAIRFAERDNLLTQIGSGVHYELTKKGIDIAHERELRKDQQSLTKSQNMATNKLADFTVILGVAALVQAAAAVVSAPRYSVHLSVFYIVILVALLSMKDDLFSRW